MKSAHTIEQLRTGMSQSKINETTYGSLIYSLLNNPFEYSTCFNQALKDVIATLPDRPKRESAEEVVCQAIHNLRVIA
jgi:hypothetical protein